MLVLPHPRPRDTTQPGSRSEVPRDAATRTVTRRRTPGTVAALLILVAACGGESGDTTITAPPTTTPPSTTATSRPPTTTTSTTLSFVVPEAIDDLVNPTTEVRGFRFTATDLSGLEREDGLVAVGIFVGPDAFSCTLGNPTWMSPELGTITAIGDAAWWDDGFAGPQPHDRDDEFITESFSICPGAPEFWRAPLLDGTRVAFGLPEPSEEVEGYATMVIPLISTDPSLVLDEGSLWVTSAGWPIKLVIAGTAPGGSSRVRGIEPDDPAESVSFEYGLELTSVDAPSLWVRAPDGSAVAGPLGVVEPAIPDLPVLSAGVREAIGRLESDRCQSESWVGSILIPLGADAGLGEFSVSSVDPEYGFNQVIFGTYVPQDGLDDKISTGAEPDLAADHAMLVFGHLAPFVAFTEFTGLGFESTPIAADGALDFAVWNGTSDERIATWDGDTVRFADGTESELFAIDMLHSHSRLSAVSDTVMLEGWAIADEWAATVLDVADLVATGDPQAVADMRAVAGQLDAMSDIGCMLLAHSWTDADEELDRTGNMGPGVIAAEERAQALLLMIDYLRVMVAYLQLPEVDWLEAPGVDLNDHFGPDGSAQEYLNVAGSAVEGAWVAMEIMKSIVVEG